MSKLLTSEEYNDLFYILLDLWENHTTDNKNLEEIVRIIYLVNNQEEIELRKILADDILTSDLHSKA